MQRIYKVIRAILMAVVTLAVILPTLTFVALSLPSVHNAIRRAAESGLSELLGAEVKIRELGIRPINRALLRDISVMQDGDTLLTIQRLGAGVSLYKWLTDGEIAGSYAEIIGLDARLSRDSANAPLNIQPIIDRLKGDGTNPPARFRARINTVVIRSSSVSYRVKSEEPTPGRFNPADIRVSDLRADINIPRLTNDTYDINLRRLALREQSGLDLRNLQAVFHLSPDSIGWRDVELELPVSAYRLADSGMRLRSGDIKGALTRGTLLFDLEGETFLPDYAAFLPALDDLPLTISTELRGRAGIQNVEIDEFSFTENRGDFRLSLDDADLSGIGNPDEFTYRIGKLRLSAGGNLAARLQRAGILRFRNADSLAAIDIEASGRGNALVGNLAGKATMGEGSLDLSTSYRRPSIESPITANISAIAENFDLATALDRPDIGKLNAELSGTISYGKRLFSAEGDAAVHRFEYRGHSYDLCTATGNYRNGDFDADITLTDESANLICSLEGSTQRGAERLAAEMEARGVDFNALNLTKKYPGYKLSADATVDLHGSNLRNLTGRAALTDIRFANPAEKHLTIDSVVVNRNSTWLAIASDYVNGELNGQHDFETIVPLLKDAFLRVFPALDTRDEAAVRRMEFAHPNKFEYTLTINQTEPLADFFNLPVSVIYPMTIDGNVDSQRSYAQVHVDAPYLRKGNKVVENSTLTAVVDGMQHTDNMFLTTSMPTKEGLMDLVVKADGGNNDFSTDISWKISRAKAYRGNLSLTGCVSRDELRRPIVDIDIHPTDIEFNDTLWSVKPARIDIDGDKRIGVEGVEVSRADQFVKIGGIVSSEPEDTLKVDVLNFNLDYLFETLQIKSVMLGGDATGEIYASQLLTAAPHIETEGIHVKNISYNKCLLGDALVKSHWDIEDKAVVLDALISQTNGHKAKLLGKIYPIGSRLDLDITADKTPVAFLNKYMANFASDVSGLASGHARIYGTFKNIDLTGNIFAEDLRLKVKATNAYFSATDSVIMTPGRIDLKNITLRDIYGHTARLNGEVTHEFFRYPKFRFDIDNAREMLVYEETSRDNPDWYGRLFVNGGARINGVPGLIKVDVDATTAPGSQFTFVLSKLEVADEYTFLAFRDRNKVETVVEETEIDRNMGLVNRLREMAQKRDETRSSDYVLEFRVGITPQAEVNLVMDPVSGDKIRSYGSGNLRMVYTSKENDLQMFGTYTLERGTYNFTLQDIIIKDFTINEGSSIAFTGNPLDARLDIEAYYGLNANLSDLDESFLQDKDLNRTNVPVRALLKVRGDIQQPEIGFDLAFPTLTSDTYRKVRSIVSTEEMMNRQIIYLLALNRFYTPEYMGSTTKGNELFSVASSTLTSQLSNILGHLSDNWAISPNLRSDRGDFSDVEVDVALTSRLLNNRLLLNGNFGYRDKTLNSNQFVGDFEIQYLLNRSGNVRLKAYSYSNDENYYVRTAATTQGVGVMFKRDFDSWLDLFRRSKKQ